MKKLTPELFLYLRKIEEYKSHNNKEPTDYEKMEMFSEAQFEYKHATVHDKLIIERHVDMMNEINYADEERKRKKVKPELKRKK